MVCLQRLWGLERGLMVVGQSAQNSAGIQTLLDVSLTNCLEEGLGTDGSMVGGEGSTEDCSERLVGFGCWGLWTAC